ncbi:hypothetical protein AB7M47_003648 [Bradyrhizobium elkanii]
MAHLGELALGEPEQLDIGNCLSRLGTLMCRRENANFPEQLSRPQNEIDFTQAYASLCKQIDAIGVIALPENDLPGLPRRGFHERT